MTGPFRTLYFSFYSTIGCYYDLVGNELSKVGTVMNVLASEFRVYPIKPLNNFRRVNYCTHVLEMLQILKISLVLDTC